jgi:hypothetical protein
MIETLEQTVSRIPLGAALYALTTMADDLSQGKDQATAALRDKAASVGCRLVVVGGAAVIRHGYVRTTKDRDFFVDYRGVHALCEVLMVDPDWERLEIRQYAFLYRPAAMPVDFLVSRDLIELGRPYYFPDIDAVEVAGDVEGVPVLGLHDLLYFKLMAGRMRDMSDIMELCKRHLSDINPDRIVGHLLPEDDDLRQKFLAVLAEAPIELERERSFGARPATDDSSQ